MEIVIQTMAVVIIMINVLPVIMSSLHSLHYILPLVLQTHRVTSLIRIHLLPSQSLAARFGAQL